MGLFRQWTVCAALLNVLAANVWGQDAGQSGVLIGSLAELDHHYSTLYIRHMGESVGINLIPNLLVPTKDDFFAVGNYYTLDQGDRDGWNLLVPAQTAEEHISFRQFPDPAFTDESLFRMPFSTRIEANCANISRTLTFVSGAYVSWEQVDSYDCSAHPDANIQLRTFRFNDKPQSPMAVSVLGTEIAKSFDTEAQSVRKKNGCGAEAEENETDWQITRGPGKWVVAGWVPTHRSCGYGENFMVSGSVPESITGPVRLSFDWKLLQTSVPGLVDAFESPRKDMLVAITKSELLVYLPRSGKLGNPVLRKTRQEVGMDNSTFDPPFGSDHIVMVQWALGDATGRWLKQVSKIEP